MTCGLYQCVLLGLQGVGLWTAYRNSRLAGRGPTDDELLGCLAATGIIQSVLLLGGWYG